VLAPFEFPEVFLVAIALPALFGILQLGQPLALQQSAATSFQIYPTMHPTLVEPDKPLSRVSQPALHPI
jgi:hypothetical protein